MLVVVLCYIYFITTIHIGTESFMELHLRTFQFEHSGFHSFRKNKYTEISSTTGVPIRNIFQE